MAPSVDRGRTDRLSSSEQVGITPIRALDEVPDHGADVIYRARTAPAPIADELERIARASNGRIRVHVLVGSREQLPMDARSLAALVPRIRRSDVYACGPVGFLDEVRTSSQALGIPADRIHDELFEF
jgi:ferredoxin-NADP reductase